MKTNSLFIIITLLLASVFSGRAQQANNSPLTQISTVPISHAEKITFHSKILDEKRVMNIYLPESFHDASEDHTYPIIMISGSHGVKFFQMISGVVKHLSSVTRMPEAIVISFDEEKHYAPNVYTNGMWGSTEELEFNADPDQFVKHLKEELFPYLKKQYRANDYRMIIGVSGSSVFPLHTFAKEPDLFRAHITVASADMIGMGYRPNTTFIDAFEESFIKNPNRKGQLYLGIASSDLKGKKQQYQNNLDELQKRLAPFQSKNLMLKVETIPNEEHYDCIIKAMLSSIEMIFPIEEWSPKFRDIIKQPGNALENIDVFHQKLSTMYGFPILPKAERWNSVNSLRFIGGKLLKDGRIKESIEVFKRRVEYRPKSPWAYNSLSEALEKDNQLKAAIEAQQKAVELAKEYDSQYVSEYQKQLSKLKDKLEK
ncbi:alpha/beta hydrolase-fold protein [Aquimarina algiphila]|uniref:alpha/beta hydrolase-fold protein n=1 Tax=Aquimarina algiphila TaxID=2047982 RepID=UPI00232C3757|nr:alpha/beta hydrolase-fold protein [Aquimarina algiphila]